MIKTSNDGSHTVVSEKFQVTYHSMYGAITESKVVFIDSGLEYLFQSKKNSISVFEMGFGTGLNAFMSALWASEKHANISYTGIEAYPISEDNFKQLNFADFLGFKDLFLKIHQVPWNQKTTLSPHFNLQKIETKLQDYKNEDMFDVIFYDAFGPGTQQELWETDIMDKMFNILSPGGLLVTYCAQGQFRRNLKQAGFIIEKIPGPPGKREMTRATRMK
ncbi:MAG: tRNA (5-methylaminomethyl-2-thiouridine)(34)-methyltransferase MnmD [Saprospiraceae bacterium]|nr:tRNA (5-methylaminomethyl-2-thiouridine)(34)-methyltransferase MnmD [Saprospiraceae bacterium]